MSKKERMKKTTDVLHSLFLFSTVRDPSLSRNSFKIKKCQNPYIKDFGTYDIK